MLISKKIFHPEIILCLCALFSVLLICPSLQAKKQDSVAGDEVAPAPQMVVGEEWVLRTHRGLRFHKVLDVGADGGFTVEVKDEEGVVLWHRKYDSDYRILGTNFLTSGDNSRPEAPWDKGLNFPLFIGKKWQDEFRGEGADGTLRIFNNTWEVEKTEMVETPVGTLRAFKIHRNYTASGMRQRRDQYYWYSPEVKIVIKLVHVGGFRTEEGNIIQNDLVSYQPAAAGQKIVQIEGSIRPLIKDVPRDIVHGALQGNEKERPDEVLNISGTRWAVIIGISKYKDTKISQLRYAAADASSFYDWLVSPQGGRYAPARVKLLLDGDATGENMRKALFEWLTQAIEEDTVTIYFAGHGSPQSPTKPENLFLLPYDVQYASVASTGFPMWDIETALRRFIKAKKVIVITDACHAGGVGEAFDVAMRAGRGITIAPVSSTLQNLSNISDGICIISASDDSQFSQEGEQWGGGHGVFTFQLLDGLKGKADYNKDGFVTLGELIPFLSEQIRRATRNAQTPTVAGRFDPALSIGK